MIDYINGNLITLLPYNLSSQKLTALKLIGHLAYDFKIKWPKDLTKHRQQKASQSNIQGLIHCYINGNYLSHL